VTARRDGTETETQTVTVPPLKALALIDDENRISLLHLFAESKRDEWQSELDALTEKLKRKGSTHSMRIVGVTITPESA
jgi:hypothetical protein